MSYEDRAEPDGSVLYGMDRELADKAKAKFDPVAEASARQWIEAVLDEKLGSLSLQEELSTSWRTRACRTRVELAPLIGSSCVSRTRVGRRALPARQQNQAGLGGQNYEHEDAVQADGEYRCVIVSSGPLYCVYWRVGVSLIVCVCLSCARIPRQRDPGSSSRRRQLPQGVHRPRHEGPRLVPDGGPVREQGMYGCR